jgi:hypothetical protein
MASRHNRHKGLLDLGPNYTRSGIKYAWVSPSPTLTTCPGSIAGLRVSPSPGSHGLVCSLTAKQILLGSGRTGSACHGQKPVSSRPMLRRASSAPLQVGIPQRSNLPEHDHYVMWPFNSSWHVMIRFPHYQNVMHLQTHMLSGRSLFCSWGEEIPPASHKCSCGSSVQRYNHIMNIGIAQPA